MGGVDAEGPVHDAAAAEVAFGVGHDGCLFEEVRIDRVPAFQNFPHGLLDLGHRGVAGIAVPGDEIVAAVGAQAAVHAGLDIRLEPGSGLGFEHLGHDLSDPLRGDPGGTVQNPGILC